jgi:hypothetical protein
VPVTAAFSGNVTYTTISFWYHNKDDTDDPINPKRWDALNATEKATKDILEAVYAAYKGLLK